jgi:hypothetical protein
MTYSTLSQDESTGGAVVRSDHELAVDCHHRRRPRLAVKLLVVDFIAGKVVFQSCRVMLELVHAIV